MKTIKHQLLLETVIDEKHEVSSRLWALPPAVRIKLINEMVNDLLVPKLEPILEEMNKNGSYAIMKVRK
jgi:hypothetical protein